MGRCIRQGADLKAWLGIHEVRLVVVVVVVEEEEEEERDAGGFSKAFPSDSAKIYLIFIPNVGFLEVRRRTPKAL